MADGPPDPAQDDQTTRTTPAGFQEQERIGPYRLLQRIGTGGMGEVYLAEQKEPIRRFVAVKVVKPGMDSKEVLSRFEAERQALALLDHPNIAKVLDAGSTLSGRPYFVMEHIKGTQINHYCDKHKLTLRERLEIFMQLCDGVQHAHQKAIIHRDLKPSNVLVSVTDDKPIAKIIDFGVAKAMSQRLTKETLYTALGRMIGTPEYMSPEQAEMTSEDIDTRTDIYGLGVILYELLTGTLPFTTQELRRAGFPEIVRILRETDPPRPSARVSTLGALLEPIANTRRSAPHRLKVQLRGDLDWITMKAMEKDRTRRYGSASELASDISRHLNHLPVSASPPSALYRARKFARRHRLGVGIGVVSVFVVAVFAIAMAVQARRLAEERDRATQESEHRRNVSEFLEGLFSDIDPMHTGGQSITLREVLDRGAGRIEQLQEQPSVQVDLMLTLGNVYANLGFLGPAEDLLEQARRLSIELHGPTHRDVRQAMHGLAVLARGRGDIETADSLLTLSLHAPDQDPLGDTFTADALHDLAVVRRMQGRFGEAESLYVRVVELHEQAYGRNSLQVGKSLSDLGVLHFYAGELDRAESRTLEAIEVYETTEVPNYLYLGESMSNLGAILREQNEYRESITVLSQAVALQRQHLGPQHWYLGRTLGVLGKTYSRSGDAQNALRALEESHAIYTQTLGEANPTTHSIQASLVDTARSYANDLRSSGRTAEADSILERYEAATDSNAKSDTRP